MTEKAEETPETISKAKRTLRLLGPIHLRVKYFLGTGLPCLSNSDVDRCQICLPPTERGTRCRSL